MIQFNSLTLLLGLIMLASCGWHLRAPLQFPAQHRQLLITPHAPYTPLQKQLRYALSALRVQVCDKPLCETAPTIELIEDNYRITPAVITTNGELTENRIDYVVRFRVSTMNQIILPEQVIRRSQRAFYDPNRALLSGRINQEQQLKQLRTEIVSIIIQQVAGALRDSYAKSQTNAQTLS